MPPDRSTGVQQGRCVCGAVILPSGFCWSGHDQSGAVSPEPREEKQEPPDWNIEGMTEPEAGPPSVASALRRTASRLRDPEYHWYEHAAVTLERLAEELEKGRDG